MSKRGHDYGSNEQRKSVFDRLGRQLAASGRQMNRRPSPRPYDEQHMQKPPMNEPDFPHYGPRDPQMQAELDWHYQNERRQIGAPGKERHPPPMGMGPPYQMEMMNRPAYYPPHMNSYHDNGPPMHVLPMMGQNAMQMGMHQRREMPPKYDRQGNIVPGPGFKDRPGPMRMVPMGPPHMGGMSPPPPNFISGQMLPPGAHDMSSMRPTGMYQPQRWGDNMDMLGPHQHSRILPPEDHFGFPGYPPQQPPMMNAEPGNASMPMGPDVPRYAKWRERRDFITNLDRETAQSSSRTDSLKSSLQQQENRGNKGHHRNRRQNNASKQAKQAEQQAKFDKTSDTNQLQTNSSKNDPHDISDGEIIDDDEDDSSDESEVLKNTPNARDEVGGGPLKRPKTSADINSKIENDSHSDTTKRRRLADREDYSMDYETISDEDLDDFMGDKKLPDLDESKMGEFRHQTTSTNNSSELELLNALGLDWAHLVEISKQTRTPRESQISGSALARFSIQNYIPSLKISPDLAGHEISELISKVCRA